MKTVEKDTNNKKANKICLVSGKGGCGKTTAALIFAKLLAVCKQKVLLVDCDVATHGASCFLYNQIISSIKSNGEVAFLNNIIETPDSEEIDYKIIGNEDNEVGKIAKISDIYFLPYDIREKEQRPIIPYRQALKNIIMRYLDKNFDVIIFDCQAGYNTMSQELVGICDSVIFMNEDDVASETATELLRGRLTDETMTKQRYLVLNKCVNAMEKHRKSNNQLVQHTKPIVFNQNVGSSFTDEQFMNLDFTESSWCPDYLDDILEVAKMCFSEYADMISEKKQEKEQKEERENKIVIKLKEEDRIRLHKQQRKKLLIGIIGAILFMGVIVWTILIMNNKYYF